MLVLWAATAQGVWWQGFAAAPNGTSATPPRPTPQITVADMDMAYRVIREQTQIMPGIVPGSRVPVGPGRLTPADELVLLALKIEQQTGQRLGSAWFDRSLGSVDDSPGTKIAAAQFWRERGNRSPPNSAAELRVLFSTYLAGKTAAMLAAHNRTEGQRMRADEVVRRAMEAERSHTEAIRAGEERGRLTRDQYQADWSATDTEARADAAARDRGESDAMAQRLREEADLARQAASQAAEARRRVDGAK
jgi:hypothetical protein